MNVVVIGAGAMGSSYGGLLALTGEEVQLIDTWSDHVRAINEGGLHLVGARGEHTIEVAAATRLHDESAADMAIVLVDSNATEAAAQTAVRALKPEGFAVTFQNGIGNVETLQRALGVERVLGGSSMCSAAIHGPGRPDLTHIGTTSVGETDGRSSERATALAGMLEGAGLPAKVEEDIMAKIWSKFVLNSCINAICATTGLRLGEVARLPELDAFQDHIIDEALAVTEAKGITLPDPDIRATIKHHCWTKFSRPSMLQHVEAGRKTEVDAINGALVREARLLGVPTPYNEALTALLKGRELHQQRAVHEPELDYNAWESEVQAELGERAHP